MTQPETSLTNPTIKPASARPSDGGTPARVKPSQRSKQAAGSAPIAITVPRKLRADSTFNKLTPEQRHLVGKWLTVDNMRYADAVQKFEREFGFKVGMTALSRIFQHHQEQRLQAQQAIKVELVIQMEHPQPLQVKVLRNGVVESTLCVEPVLRHTLSTKNQ